MRKKKKTSCWKMIILILAIVSYAGMNMATVHATTTNFKYSYTLYGVELTPKTVGEQTDRNCAKGASDIFNMIFERAKDYKIRYDCPYNILRGKSADERTLTEEHIEEYIKSVPLGARIRICASDDTTTNNNDNTKKGHTQILVDRTDKGFTVLECAEGTKMHATTYSWEDYVRNWNTNKKYGYIFYIMDFTSMIPEGYAASSSDAITGYSQSDYGLPSVKEIYPADSGEDGSWPLPGSVSYFYNANKQMVLRYVDDEVGAPEEAYVYVYGKYGPTEVYRYDCKRGITHQDGTQEYLSLGKATYTYNKEGMLEKVKWHYDDFVGYKKNHPTSIRDVEFASHEITYEFLYAATGKCLSGDYIWNHFEEFYFPGTVTWVRIEMDRDGKLSSIYGYEDDNGSYNFTEPPVVAMDYTCDSKGNVTAVDCMTVSGGGSYSIEYQLKNGHRQSAVQYDAYGGVTSRETYTYYPPEDMGNYTSTPSLEIESVYEEDFYDNTKTVVLYCDSQSLGNRTVKNTAYWKSELEGMPMLKTACGF